MRHTTLDGLDHAQPGERFLNLARRSRLLGPADRPLDRQQMTFLSVCRGMLPHDCCRFRVPEAPDPGLPATPLAPAFPGDRRETAVLESGRCRKLPRGLFPTPATSHSLYLGTLARVRRARGKSRVRS